MICATLESWNSSMRMKRARRCWPLQHRLAAHEQIDGARHDVAEGAETFLLQQLFRVTKGARYLVAAAKNFVRPTCRRRPSTFPCAAAESRRAPAGAT